MNKLRKAFPSPSRKSSSIAATESSHEPISRTLKYAQDVSVSLWPRSHGDLKEPYPRQHAHSEMTFRSQKSTTEQYWAARALSAEAVLSTKELHRRELQDLVQTEEIKRTRDISALIEQCKSRQASLERMVAILVGLVALLVSLVIYLATHYTRESTVRRPPFHFTIPVLSPFTSVVEHETSIIGSKTIAMVLVAVTTLVYLLIRQRFSRATR